MNKLLQILLFSIPSETKIENADVVKICNVSKENISVTNVSIHFEL